MQIQKHCEILAACSAEILLCHVFDSAAERTSPLREQALSDTGHALLAELTGHTVTHDALGRPYLKNESGIYISIAHCDPYVVCARGPVPVGVDIERLRPVSSSVLSRYFSEAECCLIRRVAEADGIAASDNLYTKLFTQKEAIGKLLGRGLVSDLSGDAGANARIRCYSEFFDGHWVTAAESHI